MAKISLLLLIALISVPLAYCQFKFPLPFQTPLIPRKILVGEKDVYDVQISPDGRFIAFLHAHNLQLNIWSWDMHKNQEPPKPITNETHRSILRFQWLFDNRTIIYTQDLAGEENYRLFALDALEPAKPSRLLTPEEGVRSILFYVSSTHPDQVIIATNERDQSAFDLYILDLITNKKDLLFLNDKFYKSYHVDDNFTVRAAAIETDHGGMDYYSISNNHSKLIKSVNPDERLHSRLVAIDYSGQTFYWVDSSVHDLGVLMAENSNGSRREMYKAQNAEIDFEFTFFHPITNDPLVIYEDHKRLTPIVLGDQILKKQFNRLRQLLPPDFVPILQSASNDLDVWVVRAVSSRRPAEYLVYAPRNISHPLTYLFNEKFGILLYPLSDTVTVEISISDNLTEICYMTRPPTLPPYPMVLLVHGGPWMRVNWGFDTTTQTMANRGYMVLQCNFRGSTGFGKGFFNAGNGQWAEKMQDDLTKAVQWAVNRRLAIPNRVAIVGSSYGGYAVLMGLVQNPDQYACGIDVFGPSNLTTLFRGIPKYWKAELNSLKRRIGADPDSLDGQLQLQKWSPLTYASKIRRPLLVVHGANDARVKKIESDAIVNAAKTNGVNVTYMVFPDEGHSIQQAYNGLALTAVAEQFLAKCLGGRVEPIGDALSKTSAIIMQK